MNEITPNTKYPGKFHVIADSLNGIDFNAQFSISDKGKIEIEVSYSEPLIETIALTNFIEHTFQLYDIQGSIMIGSKRHSISLLNCFLSSCNWQESFDSKNVTNCICNHYVKISASAYILDVLVDSKTKIERGIFKFSALSMWADLLMGEKNNNILSIPFEKSWSTTTCEGNEITIKNCLEEKKQNMQSSYIQDAKFIINFIESKNFQEYLAYGRIYNDFFVLMTSRKSDIVKFYLSFENDSKTYEVIVNYRTCNPIFSEDSYFHFEYLIHNLSAINNWYSYYKKTNLAYALFFDTFHFRDRYMTDTLLDAYIRSFEGMITKYYSINGYFISGNRNQKIIQELKNSINSKINDILTDYKNDSYKIERYLEKYKQTILDSFSHSYELSLRTRINLFLDLHFSYFEEDFNDFDREDIIKKLISFRNAYAHADDSKLENNDLFTLIRFTKKMILVHLFSDILNLNGYSINRNRLN